MSAWLRYHIIIATVPSFDHWPGVLYMPPPCVTIPVRLLSSGVLTGTSGRPACTHSTSRLPFWVGIFLCVCISTESPFDWLGTGANLKPFRWKRDFFFSAVDFTRTKPKVPDYVKTRAQTWRARRRTKTVRRCGKLQRIGSVYGPLSVSHYTHPLLVVFWKWFIIRSVRTDHWGICNWYFNIWLARHSCDVKFVRQKT